MDARQARPQRRGRVGELLGWRVTEALHAVGSPEPPGLQPARKCHLNNTQGRAWSEAEPGGQGGAGSPPSLVPLNHAPPEQTRRPSGRTEPSSTWEAPLCSSSSSTCPTPFHVRGVPTVNGVPAVGELPVLQPAACGPSGGRWQCPRPDAQFTRKLLSPLELAAETPVRAAHTDRNGN